MADDAFLLGARDVARNRVRIERGGIDVKSRPGLDHFARDESDHQRNGRDRFEIEKCLDAYAADLLEIAHRRNAMNDGAEYDWRDHHLDQRDEPVSEWLELDPERGVEIADDNPKCDGDQHLHIENSVPRTASGQIGCAGLGWCFHCRAPAPPPLWVKG
jgi:hypothetical protein